MGELALAIPDHVVVTGTGSGLGAEVAGLLTRHGSHVIGIDLADASVTGAYDHIDGSVTEPATWDRVLGLLPDDRSASVGYIGAAAVLDVGMLDTEDLSIWRKAWEVNVLGNVLALKRLLPTLSDARHGAFVAVTSVDAQFGEQQLSAYASSKGALSAAIRSLALDWARTGVHINLLAPGPMRAGLFERHLASAADPTAFLATREARQPVGRIIGADEVANVAVFLISEQASAMQGSTVTVDGGLTAGFDFRTGAEGAAIESH